MLGRYSRLLHAIIWFGFYACATAVNAQDVDQKISELINLGQLEAAQEILEASNPSEITRLFFVGRIYKASKKFPVAITIFEEILKRDPGHINAKRELAHTLLLAGNFTEAKTNFQELAQLDSNEVMLDGYRQFLNIIEQNKPSGISLHFSFLPSSNINRGTENTAFDSELGYFMIDPSMQITPGTGVELGLSGFFRRSISMQSKVQLNWAISGTKYDIETFDGATSLLSLSFYKGGASGHWSLEPYARQTWRKDGANTESLGIKLGLERKITGDGNLAFSLLHEYRRYPLNGYLDGGFTSATVSMNHHIDATLYISGGFRSEFGNSEAEHLKYTGHTVFGRINKSWSSGTSATLGLELGRSEFVGTFPLTSYPREDTHFSVNFSALSSRIKYQGFTPRLNCAFLSNISNIAFFDYAATDCRIGFAQEF